MARYSLQFKRSVTKDLRSLPTRNRTKRSEAYRKHRLIEPLPDVQRVLKRIESLVEDPRPTGCEKLVDREIYRVRQGRYRILYEILDDVLVVLVIKVGSRDTVYR